MDQYGCGQFGLDLLAVAVSQKFEVVEDQAPFLFAETALRLLKWCTDSATVQMVAPPSPCATELAPNACCSVATHWLRAEVKKEPAWL